MLSERVPSEYLKDFPDGPKPEGVHSAALKQALDNRKFEIELYWKRATYFWTFIGAAFAAYFVLQTQRDFSVTYIAACLGFMFSLAWYYVNRGSKFWQQNWEMHVDLLETEIAGPLYKTVLQPHPYRFWNLSDAYPFSVSKINQILSLLVTLVWLLLMVRTVVDAVHSGGTSFLKISFTEGSSMIEMGQHFPGIAGMSLLTFAGVILLTFKGQTNTSTLPVQLFQRIRTYSTG